MPSSLSIESFLQSPGLIFDVRSPSEFLQGHLPSSISAPLFSDEERALVGTAYKQQGRQIAIDLGLEIVGPHLLQLVRSIRSNYSNGYANILCWRGGMRSGFVARLLESIGVPTTTLKGGYKTFRRFALHSFNSLPKALPSLRVVGGLTGCNKTEILHELAKLGEQVIDLEKIASHRGSAFGGINLPSQPSNEQFENLLAFQLKGVDFSRPIWIEDESRLIGRCCIPPALHQLMQTSPLICIKRPFEERLDNLLCTYGSASSSQLIQSTLQLMKRLGSETTKDVVRLLEDNRIPEAFTKLLSYYDKIYQYQLEKRQQIRLVEYRNLSSRDWAVLLTDLHLNH